MDGRIMKRKPIKISRLRERLLNEAISDAVHDMLNDPDFFDQEMILNPPPDKENGVWYEEDIKRFELVCELLVRITNHIYTNVFIPNKGAAVSPPPN